MKDTVKTLLITVGVGVLVSIIAIGILFSNIKVSNQEEPRKEPICNCPESRYEICYNNVANKIEMVSCDKKDPNDSVCHNAVSGNIEIVQCPKITEKPYRVMVDKKDK